MASMRYPSGSKELDAKAASQQNDTVIQSPDDRIALQMALARGRIALKVGSLDRAREIFLQAWRTNGSFEAMFFLGFIKTVQHDENTFIEGVIEMVQACYEMFDPVLVLLLVERLDVALKKGYLRNDSVDRIDADENVDGEVFQNELMNLFLRIKTARSKGERLELLGRIHSAAVSYTALG